MSATAAQAPPSPPAPARRLRPVPRLSPRARKAVLAAHVAVSVAWLGLAVAKIALGMAAVRAAGSDPALVASAYRLLDDPVTTVTRVGAIATLVTGVLLSIATRWGLLRHWWVVTKLGLTVGAILLGNQVIDGWTQELIAATGAASGPGSALAPRGEQLVWVMAVNAGLLATASVISTFKPWGLTAYGRRSAPARTARRDRRGQTLLLR